MFQLIKNLFRPQKSLQSPTAPQPEKIAHINQQQPQLKDKPQAAISSKYRTVKILFKNNQLQIQNDSYEQIIFLNEIDYISFYRDKDHDSLFFLQINDFFTIPSLATNFNQLETWMQNLPDFNHELYFGLETISSPTNTLIWVNKHKKNASIEPHIPNQNSLTQLKNGLYFEHNNFLLKWGNFRELNHTELFDVIKQNDKTKFLKETYYSLSSVTILNGLNINRLYTQADIMQTNIHAINHDIPVTYFHTKIGLGNGSMIDFEQLKNHLVQYLGEPTNQTLNLPSVIESKEISWNKGDYSIDLILSKMEQFNLYVPFCELWIKHHPISNEHHIEDYLCELDTQKSHIHKLIIPVPLQIDSNQCTHDLQNTPQNILTLLSRESLLIWFDDSEKVIGIANTQFSQLFQSTQVQQLEIQIDYIKHQQKSCDLFIHLTMKSKQTESFFVGEIPSQYINELLSHLPKLTKELAIKYTIIDHT